MQSDNSISTNDTLNFRQSKSELGDADFKSNQFKKVKKTNNLEEIQLSPII